MDGAGTLGGDANPDPAIEFRVSACRERGEFLVSGGNELGIARALQGAEDRVDAVAGIAVHPSDIPLAQPPDYRVAHQLGHHVSCTMKPDSARVSTITTL